MPVLAARRWHGRVPRAQKPTIPVVGYLSGTSPDDSIDILVDFRRGLAETGYVEGRNLAIEYRWLEGRYDRIPMMLGDLVERRVAVIAVANTTTAALAAKAATRTIPIVFAVGSDPVGAEQDFLSLAGVQKIPRHVIGDNLKRNAVLLQFPGRQACAL